MSSSTGNSQNYRRSIRRVLLSVVCLVLLGLFFLWRIDNARVENLRVHLIDRFAPSLEWTVKPLARTARMIADLRAYQRVYEQNAELRRDLQRMQGWREAALQLEQKNARLLALNNVRLSPRLTFVTGEVIADSGSPFRRSAMLNVGTDDRVEDGSVVVDGFGVVGRIAGASGGTSRVLFVTDGSSRVPVEIMPSGQRAIATGDNSPAPLLEFLDQSAEIRLGERVLTSGAGGLYPAGFLVGHVAMGPDGRRRVQVAADFAGLDYVRIIRDRPVPPLEGPGGLIGPVLTSQVMPPAPTADGAEGTAQ